MKRGFDHVETWVFDLDNTLYSPSCRLFDQIDTRMGEFISGLLKVDKVEARRIQKSFFHEHGTTLRGLMTVYGIEPFSFLDFVHDIDHSPVAACPELALALQKLPGRKLVFTNGTSHHAEKVLDRLGIRDQVDEVFDIALRFHPEAAARTLFEIRTADRHRAATDRHVRGHRAQSGAAV